jgi:hypothetical protein
MFGTKTPPAVIRIRLMTSIAGHRIDRHGQAHIFSHAPGAIVDWDETEARRYLESGIAQLAVGQELSLGMI